MIFIGTSGYSYKHWEKRFYPENLKQKDWLEYYTGFFDTVEINSTFYRLQTAKAFENWRLETPSNFIFSVKGSRYITHNKKLNNVEEPLAVFMDRASALGEKLAVILWQFPANFRVNTERLEKFLIQLKDYPYKNAFEFRNHDWFSEEVYNLLARYKAALVIANSPNGTSPQVLTAGFTYIRFHGGKLLYASEYSNNELKNWASTINKWANKGDVYAYFNNDAHAFAVKNALFLKNMINIIDKTNKKG